MATCDNIEEPKEDSILAAFSDEKLCSLCRKKILARTSLLPTDSKYQLVEDSQPIQADEDSSSTVVSTLYGTKFQYVITSGDEVPESEPPQQCTDHIIIHSDNLPSMSKLSVDSKSDSLEDKFCQLLVMGSPEIIKLEKQLEEQRHQQYKETQKEMQRLLQQIEIETREFNLKYKEFQRDFCKLMQEYTRN